MASDLSMKIHNTTKFSGHKEENWETWIFRFETRFSSVDEKTLSSVLLDVLDGAALDVCGRLDKETRKDYKKLRGALQKKFGVSSDTRRANAELRQIRQSPGENAESFADRVRKLTNLANPELSSEQLDQAALQHFLCGLCDLKLQERLHNNDTVQTLQKAEEVAQRLQEKDLTLTAMRTSAGQDMVTAVSSSEAQPHTEDEGGPATEILAMIGELRNELKDIKIQINRKQSSNTSNSSNRGACYQCGDIAHFRRDCPQLPKTRAQEHRPSNQRTMPRAISPGVFCRGCGRRGHALKECWRTPAAAGGIGPSSTARNRTGVECLNCGKWGHWAADCTQETCITPQQSLTEPRRQTNQGNFQ